MKPNRENKPTGLLAKHHLIGHCLRHPKTSKGDAAVLWYLLERYNDEAGAAWPGLGNIATNAQVDRSTVQRSINRLEAENYLTVERGGRAYKGAPGKSNRYHPNFALGAPTHLVSNNEVGAPVPASGGVHAHEVGAPTPPDSSYHPGYKAGDDKEEATASAAAGAAVVSPPPGGGGAPPHAGRRFEAFWQAYPPKPGARTGPVEDQIEALLAKGITLDAIVAGARAYAASIRANPFHDPKYTREPKKWLIERGWLDNHTTIKPTTPPQASAKAVKAGAKKKSKPAKKSGQKKAAEYIPGPVITPLQADRGGVWVGSVRSHKVHEHGYNGNDHTLEVLFWARDGRMGEDAHIHVTHFIDMKSPEGQRELAAIVHAAGFKEGEFKGEFEGKKLGFEVNNIGTASNPLWKIRGYTTYESAKEKIERAQSEFSMKGNA